jgi:hypothetical protein
MNKFYYAIFGSIFLLLFSSSFAQKNPDWSWPQCRNTSGGSPEQPTTIYLGDNGTFGCDSWGTVDDKWGKWRVVIYTGSDIHNGSYGSWSGYGNNEHKTNTSQRFSQTGTWYWGIQVEYTDAGGTTGWYCRNNGSWYNMWGTPTSEITITVNSLNNPSSQNATQNGTNPASEIDLSWSKDAQNHNVMIVRKKSTESWTEPAQGTAYTVGATMGSGVVVYNSSGTSYTNTGLSSSTIYDYKYYSENYSYYSAGVVASASTASSASDYYRSKATGNWSDNSTWESSNDNSFWINATLVPTSSANTTIIDHSVTITGTQTANALTINSGKTLTINPTKSLTVNGTLTNSAGEAGLIIKSNATGTGSLISSTANVDARVERFLTKMKWHFIGMPVESAVAGVFHLSSGHSDIWLRPHDETTNTWGEEIIPVETPLALGKGYECWVGDDSYNNDETIVFPGQLNAGDLTTGSGGFYGLTYSGTGYNFISNPYPSALKGNINTWTKTNVDNSIWVWQGTGTGMGGGGNYLTWNGTTGSLTGGIIPAMQGFFVHANNSGASLTLPQSSRTHSSQLYYKDSGLPLNTLRVNVTGNSCFDAVFIGFNDFASEEYDSEYDVVKMYGISQAPQLYSIIPGNELSINILPAIGDDRIVPIGFECEVPSTFKLETIGMDGFEPNTEFYLEDMKEGIIQNMEDNPVYIFTNESGDEAERFRLHFGMPNSITESSLDKVQIYSFDNLIHIRNPNMEKIQVYVYDIVGRLILSDDYNGVSLIKINTHVETGYYVVKVLSGGEVTQKKVFLK